MNQQLKINGKRSEKFQERKITNNNSTIPSTDSDMKQLALWDSAVDSRHCNLLYRTLSKLYGIQYEECENRFSN